MKKRIISIILSIVMLVGLLPTTAWAGELDPIVRSCTCGASADADGVILHVSDCPLYAGLEEEPEEEPAEELAAPAVLERPYDEETSSDTVLYVDGQWDTYCWEIYTDNTFEWTVYADTAEIIVDKETYVASAFRCTVTLGDQSAVTEPAAYNTELIKPTVSLRNTKMARDRSAYMVLAKAASDTVKGRSAYMVWTKDDSVFNIRGLDGSYEFRTTFMDRGYRSWIKVDDTSRAGTGGQVRDGLTYDITPSLVYGGRYVKITYTVVNTGSKTYTFRIGSAADVMIDDNDRAPVVGLTGGGGLVMSGSPRNKYKFNLVAPSADTLWYGYWIEADKNVFNDRADKTTEYDKDSGMAWSWKDEVIKPGETWKRSVLIGVGELPVAPKMPQIPSMPEFVAGKDGTISGTATPGDTVYVTIDGEEYFATADENGNFSINVLIPAEQPDNTLDMTYYAVSPDGGISKITSKKVNVATAPRIVLKQSELTLMEEDTAPNFNSFIADSAGDVSITSAAVNTNVPGTYTVTYTASVSGFDPAAADLRVTVVPKPAELTAASCTHGSASFALNATMTYTGGNTYTETGFVYAPYRYPTLTDCAGKVNTSSPVNTKGGTLSASVADSDLINGVSYYARPYAKFGDAVIYGGESANFGLGVPSYGSVRIINNGNNTFTVSRTDGSYGKQIVHFRTVNGSAVGGTHFTHQTGTVTIPDGATTAGTTISIAELGVDQTYDGKAATAYSNADRTYQVEVYLVEGGASIGTGKATRTMTKNDGYVIDRTIYSEYKTQEKAEEVARGDYDDDKKGWTDGHHYGNAKETITIASTPGFSQRAYWVNTADAIKFRLQFDAKEVEDGYQHIQITPGQYLDLDIYPYKGNWNGSRSTTLYVATFEHGGTNKNTSYSTYYFPVASGSNTYTPSERFFGTQDGNQYVQLPVTTSWVSIGYTGSGSGKDEWRTKNQYNKFMLKDTKEPQLLGIAPMADTTYVPGQQMTLALIFDEIVDQTNSAAAGLNSGTVLYVDWTGDSTADAGFNYAGGLDTNVLYFTCILPDTMNVTGERTLKLLQNNDLSAKIKDMCSENGSTSTSYAGKTVTVKFDSTTPSVGVSALSTDAAGFTSGTITASDFTRLEYVWSQNSTSPVAGWESVGSGKTVKTRQTEGTWYLHARATNTYGRTATAAKAITFAAGVSGGTPVVLPELKVSVDNTNWVKEQREISITRQPNAATVAVTKPNGSIEDVSGNTYTATTNGIYTFTLTSGSETITKMVNVARIDYNAPAVAIEDLTNFIHTAAVTLTVTAADTESGLMATPLSGVWKNGTEEVTATFTSAGDGVWTTTSPDATGSWVLTVTATDAVGRTSSDTSETYIINAERPTITISNRQETDAGITYNYAVQENGNEGVTVTLPDGTTTTALTGTVLLTESGSYYIFVTDARGHYVQSAEMTVPQSTTEKPVDYTAPDVRYDTDPYVWTNANAVTVTLNIFEEQGLSSVTYRKSGETTETVIDISGVSADADYTYTTSFTVTENGTYTVTAKDVKGNTGTMDVVVDFIDRTNPNVGFNGTFGQWMKANQTIMLQPTDPDVDGDNEGASGVAKVEYAVSADKTAVPAALTVLENPYQVTISENGTWYIYYKITDNAGNVATGWSEAVKVDKVTPVIAVDTSAAMTGAGEQTVSVTATFGVSGGEVTVGGDTLTMESTAQSGTYTEEKTNTYVIRAKGVYDFVATSAAGETASQTVTVYGIDFDSNGGNKVADQIVVSGGKATAPETITRTGYTFGGWYKEQACENAWFFATDVVTENTTLYAKWTEKASVSIIATAQTYTWDGNPKSFAISGKPETGFAVAYKVNDNWTNTAPSAVGTYNVKITRAEDNTYKAYEKEITGGLVINAAAPTATAPTAKTGLVYDSNAKSLINAGTSEHGYWEYSLDGTSYSSDIPTGTDAKTYTVYCRFVPNTGYANINPVELSVTIDPMAVNEPSVTGTYTYTGEEQTATVTGKEAYMTETGAVKGTNAGDYTITYTLDGNHCWADGSDGTVTWSIGKANYTNVTNTASANLKATSGSTVEITLPTIPDGASYGTAAKTTETDKYTLSAISGNKITATSTGISDGTTDMTFTVSVTPDDNHNGYDITVTITPVFHTHSFTYAQGKGDAANTITAKCTNEETDCDIADRKVTLTLTAPVEANLVYSGAVKEVTFKDGEVEAWKNAVGSEAPSIEYYLVGGTTKTTANNSGAADEGNAPVTAGKYVAKATVTYGEGQSVTATEEFTIAQKEVTVTITPNGGTYGGTITGATATLSGLVEGKSFEPVLTYTGTDYNSTEVPEKAGSYTVTASLPDAASNYKLTGTVTADFTIAKAFVDAPTINSKTYTGETLTADVDCSGKPYTVKTNAGGTAVGEYDVVLTLSNSDNYKWSGSDDADKTLKFRITKAENSWTTTPAIKDVSYGTAITPAGAAKFGEVVITYVGINGTTYSSSTTAPTDAGSYQATFAVTGTENYGSLEQTVEFAINKADYTGEKTASGNLKVKEGSTVDVTLPKLPEGASYATSATGFNFGTATVANGKLTLTVDDKGIPENTEPFDVTIAVSGATNYKDYVVTVTVTPSSHTHSFTYSASGAVITATCNNEDEQCGLTDKKVTLTLTKNATENYYVYDVNAKTVDFANGEEAAWKAAVGSNAPTVTYTAKEGSELTENKAVNAGSYTATVTVDTNKTATLDFTITKATQTATVSMSDYTYGGTVSTPSISGAKEEPTATYYYNTTNSNEGGTKWENIEATTLGADTYYMYANVAATANYKEQTTEPVEFAVSKATPSADDFNFTAPGSLIYDGQNKTANVVAQNSIEGMGNVTVYYQKKVGEDSWSEATETAPKDAGEYKVSISVAEGDNYTSSGNEKVSTENWTFTVNKRTVTLVADSAEKEYDGQPLTCDTFTVKADTTTEGYGFVGSEGVQSVTMTAASTITDPGSVDNEIDSYIFKDGTNKDNYEISTEKGTLTVKESDDLTVSTVDYEGFYDGEAHNISYTVKINNDVIEDATVSHREKGTTDWIPVAEFTPYTDCYKDTSDDKARIENLVIEVKAEKRGYKTVTDSAKITIKPRPVTLVAGSNEKVYDGTPLTCTTFTVKEDTTTAGYGFVEGQGINNVAMTAASTITGVGTQDNVIDNDRIVAKEGTKLTNYSISTEAGELKITKAALTVKAKDKSITYGDAAANGGVEYSGFVNNETASVLGGTLTYSYKTKDISPTDYTTTSPVGSYDIIPSGLTSQNYGIAFVKGTLTVSKAALTATADSKTVTYGDNAPEYTVIYNGWKNGAETPTTAPVLTSAYTSTSNVGNYGITFSIPPVFANYNVTTNEGTLTVTTKDITVEITPNGGVYGGTIEPATAEFVGLVSGDALTPVLTYTDDKGIESAEVPKEAGTYKVTAKLPEEVKSSNYKLTGEVTAEFKITVPADPKENYTVPVESEDTVQVEASIEKGTAEVKEITKDTLEEIVKPEEGKKSTTDTIVIDLSQAKQEVTGIVLTAKSVENLKEVLESDKNEIKTVVVQMSEATVEIDAKTLETVSKEADGNSIRLVVDKTEEKNLNTQQQETLAGYNVNKTFEAYFESNGQRISSFNGGEVVVGIKFTPGEGKNANHYKIYYIDENGKMQKFASKYENGMLKFSTTHFSDYAIIYDDMVEVLLLQGKASGKSAIKLSWNELDNTTKYVVYGNSCGKTAKKLKTVKNNKFTVKKIAGKKLVAHKVYKFYVVGYDAVGNKTTSKTIHFITANTQGKYANVKSIKAKASTLQLAVGEFGMVGATYKMYSGKKHLGTNHGKALRYISDNPEVVSVSSTGKVLARQAGTATIYIQDVGGKYVKTVVTVKAADTNK